MASVCRWPAAWPCQPRTTLPTPPSRLEVSVAAVWGGMVPGTCTLLTPKISGEGHGAHKGVQAGQASQFSNAPGVAAHSRNSAAAPPPLHQLAVLPSQSVPRVPHGSTALPSQPARRIPHRPKALPILSEFRIHMDTLHCPATGSPGSPKSTAPPVHCQYPPPPNQHPESLLQPHPSLLHYCTLPGPPLPAEGGVPEGVTLHPCPHRERH